MAHRIGVTLFLVALLFAKAVVVAEGHHQEYLPNVPNTPLMQTVIQDRLVKWCANTAAFNYPNFISQVEDVHAAYTRDVGINFQRVAFGTRNSTGCQLQHNMTEFNCNGCSAHIFYANVTVLVEYKPSLGYADWRSAIGHELGHGLLGLHEQYIDLGSIRCDYRPDTVMSCGPPFVKYPQPRDVNLGCAIIATSWCGEVPTPEPEFFHRSDGWSYHFATRVWWNPLGQPELHPCNGDGLRWDDVLKVYLRQGTVLFNPNGYWLEVGPC